MEYGNVRFFNSQRGWGFIDIDGSDDAAFVHYSAINMDGYRTLEEGQRVSFDVEKSEKGIAAVNVSVIHE